MIIRTPNNSVTYVRDEVKNKIDQWNLIKDCIEGEVAVKKAGVKYLPVPNNSSLIDEADIIRYNSYKLRASFYNATAQTLKGLVGQVFTRDPLIEIPDKLQSVAKDVDGSAIDTTQLGKIGVNLVMPYGRAGILVDYTNSNDVITKAEIDAGEARSVLRIYNPWDIINWRYTVDVSGKRKLTLVVLKEERILEDNGFSYEVETQYRELRLENGICVVYIWNSDGEGGYTQSEPIIPANSKGMPFNQILFSPIGSENNTLDVDNPPLYDLASINIAHYRNSADYEESVFMTGQPTPIITGLDESWAKEVLKGGFVLGSRKAVPLPKNADCKLLAAEPNGMVKEAMELKERQMVALGAKLVEQRQVQRTAMEAGLEASAEGSTLVSVARNVSQAVKQALMWASEFEGVEGGEIKFALNTDFALNKMTTEELNGIISSWQKGAISWDEMRINIRKGNIELTEDELAKLAIDKEQQTRVDQQTKLAEANNQKVN